MDTSGYRYGAAAAGGLRCGFVTGLRMDNTRRYRIERRPFAIMVDERQVPGMAWVPVGERHRPLVLVGHGGSGHKDSQLVRDAAEPLAGDHGFVVAAIDGPVHGDRRAVFADGRIRAAVLGMWGTCRAGSEQLASDAPRIGVPTLFQRKAGDEFFTVDGQQRIFELLGDPGKRLAVYPGGHTDPRDDQLRDIVDFLVDQLGTSRAGATD